MQRLATLIVVAAAVLVVATTGAVRADIVTGLVGHYTFDAGNANDTAGTNHGANVGSPGYPVDPDPFRSTVLGVSDGNYVQIPNMPVLPIGNASRTFAAWAKIDNYENDAGIWHHGNTNGQQDFSLELTTTPGQLTFNGWSADFNFTFPGDPNGWHQFVVTHDGSNTRAYADGVEQGSRSGSLNTTANNIRLGGQRLNNSAAQLDGQIDDFRIYNRVLDASDISELYAATAPPTPFGQWDFWPSADLQGWTLLNGETHFRDGDGGGLTPGNASGGFAHDGAHATLLVESPEFVFSGDTLDGTNVMQVGSGGGAGDQNNAGMQFADPAAVLAYNGGNSDSTGQKGLAFLHVGTGQYDAVLFNQGNGGTDTYNLTAADLASLGVDLGATYRLHFYENDQGGWGWGQLNFVSVAAAEPNVVPEPSAFTLGLLALMGLGLCGSRRRRRT